MSEEIIPGTNGNTALEVLAARFKARQSLNLEELLVVQSFLDWFEKNWREYRLPSGELDHQALDDANPLRDELKGGALCFLQYAVELEWDRRAL